MSGDIPALHEEDSLRQGDPVTVQPDGHGWNGQERATGIIVRFPDDAFDTDGWNALTARQEVERTVGQVVDHVVLRQRRYRLDIDKVSPTRKAELLAVDTAKPVVEAGEFTVRDLLDKETQAPRFKKDDLILSGRI